MQRTRKTTFPGMFRPLRDQPDLPENLVACTCAWCIRGKVLGNQTCPKCNGDSIRLFQTGDLGGDFAQAIEVAA